jgi:hypothetical protein
MSEQELTERHERARMVKESVQNDILQYPSVRGIGVSYQTVGGIQLMTLPSLWQSTVS